LDSYARGDRPRIEARWERPAVAANGGEAVLLVRIIAPTEVETSRRAPIDVAFVLDRSGSMAGGKLELAKEGVDLAVARLRDADRAALVIYDSEVETLQPLGFTTPRLKGGLRLLLHGVDPRGSTFLSGGWAAGCKELAEAPAAPADNGAGSRIRRVILLTDGLANVGIRDPRALAQHAGELRQRGIATTTVGVGLDFDEGLLSAMAEAGGGNFQYVADPAELRAFFATELQELFSVACSGLAVAVTLPGGLHGELISAFPVERAGKVITVAIGDLAAGDAIDLVFAVRVAQGSVGDVQPLVVTAAWTDPRADARHEADVSPESLRLAEPDEIEEIERDAMVAERAALERAAAERRAGLELDRQGRHQAARDRMIVAQHLLEAAPMTADVRYSLVETDALAAAPATAAYSSHGRKLAQQREHLRRRGRVHPDATSQ
jgi:Ca-activated chloride channel family protein